MHYHAENPIVVVNNEIAIGQYFAALIAVLLPTGDEILYSKAGLMEAGDIFCKVRFFLLIDFFEAVRFF